VTIYLRNRYKAPPVPSGMSRQAHPLEAFLHHSVDIDAGQYNTKEKQTKKIGLIDGEHRARGYSMGGYHWVVFQRTGNRWAARGFQLRPAIYTPAAQLGHNPRTLAICVVGDGRYDTLHPDTIDVIAHIVKRYPGVRKLGGHRDVTPTECPGPRFYKAVPTIARRAGVTAY
jgi:hypothetical protein